MSPPVPLSTTHRFGPVRLAQGVTSRHVLCYLYAAGISIGMFTYLMTLTPYILTVNLGIPEARHGRVMGNLQFLQEIVVLACIGWWGAMSDRHGRRSVYVAAWLLMALAYGTYAFATSLPQLFLCRAVFALAVAATTTNMSAILADYPQNESRGRFVGISFVLNGLGAVVFFAGLSQLPAWFQARGASPLWAGREAYLVASAIAFVAAIVMLGLKPGRPDGLGPRSGVATLLRQGVRAARNPRIGLAYAGAFAARADMVIISLFLVLWVVQASTAAGLTPAEAQGRAGLFVGVSSLTAVVWAPLFGILSDRMNRMGAMVMAFACGALGYAWTGLLDDVTSLVATIPALILIGIGQSSTALAVTVLLGQEAPEAFRGSVFGVQNFCGALGILAISAGGGWLYDLAGPGTPFLAMAAGNAVVAGGALWLMRAEGQRARGA